MATCGPSDANISTVGSAVEIDSLREQISAMEAELQDSLSVTSACYAENTELKAENVELKTTLTNVEEVVMRLTGLFEDSDLCATAKKAVCSEEALEALVVAVQSSQSPSDRVEKMHQFLKSQRNTLVDWIDNVSPFFFSLM